MNHLWPQLSRDIQTIVGTALRRRGSTICMLNLLFYRPRHRSNHTVQWKDIFGLLGLRLGIKEAREDIRFDVSGSRPVRQSKREPVKEQRPPGLARV